MVSGDTIAAISSAVGTAARIIVRISGPEAHRLVAGICRSPRPAAATARRLNISIDGLSFPAWVYSFAAPRSYTGEDLAELHLPGNALLARMVMDELVRRGARPAEAGEFTARAYFNGRMDLTEAEGVAATIAARGQEELRAARQLLAGELARRLRPMMDELAETLALVETGIDFSEEDITFLPADQVIERAGRIDRQLQQLLAESARFERLTHEARMVLTGRPNAGKSTLLNTLAGTQRAIVSHIAGTTRDVLSAEVALDRGLAILTDAAGLEEHLPPANDPSPQASIARQMHQRALAAIESADVVVLLHDATDKRPLLALPRQPDLIVLTKIDLSERPGIGYRVSGIGEGETAKPETRNPKPDSVLPISAATGENLDLLRHRLSELAFGQAAGGSALALNGRHLQAIDEARRALDRIAAAAQGGPELLALELREALNALGRIVGQITPDDVLGRVFALFCVGK